MEKAAVDEIGKIKKIFKEKRFGFIKSPSLKKDLFFYFGSLEFDESQLSEGLSVGYVLTSRDGRQRADKIVIAPPASAPARRRTTAFTPAYTGKMTSLDSLNIARCLGEIKTWKLEAKLDDVNKYFFGLPHIENIINGDSCFVIGRKGTGKTAIAHYISTSEKRREYVSRLSFKNFPFNELYRHDNDRYTRPNQYITLWKLIIYSFTCRMMLEDSSLDPLLRDRIRKAFPPVNGDTLNALISRWLAGDVGISIFGNGFNLGNWFQKKNAFSISDKVENLEAFLLKNIGGSSYFVLFDELDEDYKNLAETYKGSEYIDLLTSLFKAVQDVKARFSVRGKGLMPVVFLRDDIYDLILDPDKNKWKDFEFDLDWNNQNIRHMLSHRLSRVIGTDEIDFEANWYSIFAPESVLYASDRKSADSYTFISRSTHGRPRDYIRYLQVCADLQLHRSPRTIEPDVVRDADKSYSNYLRDELTDEIHGLIPDIKSVFLTFSQIRKWILSVEDFMKAYKPHSNVGGAASNDPSFILQTLFYFSVIGNVTKQGSHIFRHDNPESKLNFTEKIVVHRGLMKSLQIL